MFTSDPAGIITAGDTVTLTCTVELSSAVDIPVIVNIRLTDPARIPLNATSPSKSGSAYTSTAMVSSFGRDQSGVYTCTATVNGSTSSFLSSPYGTIKITTGENYTVDWHI